jgi:hypothetical protein
MSDVRLSLLNVGDYSKTFLNGGGRLDPKYSRGVSDEHFNKISVISGSETRVDTPLEIAILSSCVGAIDVRPVEAVNMLPADDPKLVDKKLGAAAYMDMQAARFLGGDPAPHAAALKFITDRGRVTEAEIKTFMAQGIATAVNTTYNTVLFDLVMTDRSYTTYLTQNPDRSYTLHYERPSIENDDEEFTRPNLDALLDELKKRGFTSGNCDTVRRQSALFPVLSPIDGVTDNNTTDLIKHLLTGFYTANDQTTRLNNYKALLAIYNRYNNVLYTDIAAVNRAMGSMGNAITALNSELGEMFVKDAKHVVAVSRQQSQQVKASLMSNNIEILAGTVGEIRR